MSHHKSKVERNAFKKITAKEKAVKVGRMAENPVKRAGRSTHKKHVEREEEILEE